MDQCGREAPKILAPHGITAQIKPSGRYILGKPSYVNAPPPSSLQTNRIVLLSFPPLRHTKRWQNYVRRAPYRCSWVQTCWVEKTNGTQQMVICMIYFHTFPEDIVGQGRFIQGWEFWIECFIQHAWRQRSDDLEERPPNAALPNIGAAFPRLLFKKTCWGKKWQVFNFAFIELHVVMLAVWLQRLTFHGPRNLFDTV